MTVPKCHVPCAGDCEEDSDPGEEREDHTDALKARLLYEQVGISIGICLFKTVTSFKE